MVFGKVDNGIFAGNVGGGHNGEFMPGDGGIKGDGGDAAARDGTANGGSEPHVRQGDVVDVLGAAKYFRAPFFSGGRVTDDFG